MANQTIHYNVGGGQYPKLAHTSLSRRGDLSQRAADLQPYEEYRLPRGHSDTAHSTNRGRQKIRLERRNHHSIAPSADLVCYHQGAPSFGCQSGQYGQLAPKKQVRGQFGHRGKHVAKTCELLPNTNSTSL